MFKFLTLIRFCGSRSWDRLWGAKYLKGSRLVKEQGRQEGQEEWEPELWHKSNNTLTNWTMVEPALCSCSWPLTAGSNTEIIYPLDCWKLYCLPTPPLAIEALRGGQSKWPISLSVCHSSLIAHELKKILIGPRSTRS